MTTTTPDTERRDLLAALEQRRSLLLRALRDVTDEQARMRTTVSELCLAGIVKHVAITEHRWARFIEAGPTAMGETGEDAYAAHLASFRLEEGETLAAVLEHYDDVARRTDDLIAALPSLDVAHPLPPAPWFEPGASWSARRVVAHIIGETAQHAGHADIIREALDGAKSMG